MRGLENLDESDVRVRPSRRGSRPRTKQRPQHADAVDGMVVAVDRGRYDVVVATGTRVRAMTARELGRAGVVVGDRVGLVGDASGAPGTLARIVRVDERTTVLRRSADDNAGDERILVANADQLVIVTALAEPAPRTRMVDRCLVAAYDAGMDVLLCLTKADLADPGEFLAAYEPLDVPAVVTRQTATPDDDGPAGIEGLGDLGDRLAGRTSVLVGHSGVGKSTLVNALVPAAHRAVGGVNAVTGRGRHTSTSAVALALPTPGWVIDTPGVRSFGLGHVDIVDVIGAFPDLAEVTTRCQPRCTHLEGAVACALDAYRRQGEPEALRVLSLRRLLASRSGDDGDSS